MANQRRSWQAEERVTRLMEDGWKDESVWWRTAACARAFGMRPKWSTRRACAGLRRAAMNGATVLARARTPCVAEQGCEEDHGATAGAPPREMRLPEYLRFRDELMPRRDERGGSPLSLSLRCCQPPRKQRNFSSRSRARVDPCAASKMRRESFRLLYSPAAGSLARAEGPHQNAKVEGEHEVEELLRQELECNEEAEQHAAAAGGRVGSAGVRQEGVCLSTHAIRKTRRRCGTRRLPLLLTRSYPKVCH